MSHHHQSHQHQPHNPVPAAPPVAPTSQSAPLPTASVAPAVVPASSKPESCVKGTGKCECNKCQGHIRSRAYEISQARNGGPGNAASDWSQAEKELTATRA
jgi:hypothetical protein